MRRKRSFIVPTLKLAPASVSDYRRLAERRVSPWGRADGLLLGEALPHAVPCRLATGAAVAGCEPGMERGREQGLQWE